jgi:hypothetical protein
MQWSGKGELIAAIVICGRPGAAFGIGDGDDIVIVIERPLRLENGTGPFSFLSRFLPP